MSPCRQCNPIIRDTYQYCEQRVGDLGSWSWGRCQGESLAPKQDVMGEKQKCSPASFPMGEESPAAHGDAPWEKSQLIHLLGLEATEPSHKAGPFLSSQPLLRPLL